MKVWKRSQKAPSANETTNNEGSGGEPPDEHSVNRQSGASRIMSLFLATDGDSVDPRFHGSVGGNLPRCVMDSDSGAARQEGRSRAATAE